MATAAAASTTSESALAAVAELKQQQARVKYELVILQEIASTNENISYLRLLSHIMMQEKFQYCLNALFFEASLFDRI
jgi:hypothetical protein